MTQAGPATRLRELVNESDQCRRRPLYTEIVHRAHTAGLAGASVLRGIEGFGRSSRIHTSLVLSLTEDLPCAVVLVDTDARIRAFLPQVLEMLDGGLVTLEPVEVAATSGAPDEAR